MPRLAAALTLVTCAASCIASGPEIVRAPQPRDIAALRLAGEFNIRALQRLPSGLGLPFGGISGLAARAGGRDLLAVSDDRVGSRVYSLRLQHDTRDFTVAIENVMFLQQEPGGPRLIDPEGLVILPNSNLLVASEGIGNQEPRVGPALLEYSRYGDFVRRWETRSRYIPEPTGTQTRGVRSNAGFESLTITPDGDVVFTASETALVQDDEVATIDRGAWTRLLEYVEDDGAFVPGREFAYPLDPVERPGFEPGVVVHGVVELLALNRTELLALERTYIAEVPGTASAPKSLNRIRLLRTSITGATDISGMESLKERAGIVPLSKTLLLDLKDVEGLSPELAAGLDNFEGLVFGPKLAEGRPSLIMVSDDNFNPRQRTSFLMFGVKTPDASGLTPSEARAVRTR